MQIYIHVPFCRKKCHYCGFYSESIRFADNGGLLLPESIGDTSAANTMESNSLETKKDVLKEKKDESNRKNTKNSESEAEHTHNKTSPITKNTGVKSLSSFIPNLSGANTQQNYGVQSLADVLRSSKNSNIPHSPELLQRTGPSLADALLPQDQARMLRESLGLPQLENITQSAEDNSRSSSALLKDISNSNTSHLITSNPDASLLATAKNVQSLFLGQNLQHDDLNVANAHIRSALNGANISTFDKASRLALPLPLPKGFVENNYLSQEPLYQLWKKGLMTEIKILSEFYASTPITSIFFGGGTPSLIPIKDMDQILRALLKTFHVTHNAEISMEANPESITKEKAIAYSRMGFNRMSLGIQSLQDENLQAMGRIHSASEALSAFRALREARFHNISIDFIWGLPNQINKKWRTDVRDAITLDPEHISCYGLSIDEGSNFEELDKNGTLELPSEKEQALMYKTASDLLENAGYLQYEISNFSKIGYQCRHNLGYWQGADYMGLGPSAASTINGIRRTHASSIVGWAQDIQTNRLEQDIRMHSMPNTPVNTQANTSNNSQVNTPDNTSENSPENSLAVDSTPNFTKEILSTQDKVLELIMLRLRTSKGLPTAEYKELTGRSFIKDNNALIQILDKHNLLRVSKGHVFLTQNGMLVSSSILEKFFENTKDIFKHERIV